MVWAKVLGAVSTSRYLESVAKLHVHVPAPHGTAFALAAKRSDPGDFILIFLAPLAGHSVHHLHPPIYCRSFSVRFLLGPLSIAHKHKLNNVGLSGTSFLVLLGLVGRSTDETYVEL